MCLTSGVNNIETDNSFVAVMEVICNIELIAVSSFVVIGEEFATIEDISIMRIVLANAHMKIFCVGSNN